MRRLRALPAIAAAIGLCVGACGAALAQTYPSRPIKVIVPTPASGPVDVMARLTAHHLSLLIGQNVIVDNRAGAGNTIGSREAARAEPDGYTLLFSSASGLVISPLLYKNLDYDPIKSYAPIAPATDSPLVLVANPAVPGRSL